MYVRVYVMLAIDSGLAVLHDMFVILTWGTVSGQDFGSNSCCLAEVDGTSIRTMCAEVADSARWRLQDPRYHPIVGQAELEFYHSRQAYVFVHASVSFVIEQYFPAGKTSSDSYGSRQPQAVHLEKILARLSLLMASRRHAGTGHPFRTT